MKKIILPSIIVIGLLNACTWGNPGKQTPAITKDTLKYTYKAFKQRAKDCGTRPDSGCTVVDIKYPQFANAEQLNENIIQRITNLPSINKTPDTLLKQFAGHFHESYYSDKGSIGRHINYDMEQTVSIVRQDSGLVTLQFSSYAFTGGAHGMSLINYVNWDTNATNAIGLKDILVDNYTDMLNKTAEKIFRKQEHLADNASLKGNYFFKKDEFSLNNNYLITPGGLLFLYNVYEIKPYAAGQTRLLIPYQAIKDLLKPGTVLTQYIK